MAGTIVVLDGSGGGGGAVDSVNGQTGVVSLGLDDLNDVSYVGGSFEPTALDQIVFSSSDVPSDRVYKVFANPTYGMRVAAYDSSLEGSFVTAHRDLGVTLQADYGHIWLTGSVEEDANNEPELRWSSGEPADGWASGNYFGLKLPAGYSVDQTYTLPLVDGSNGQVLSTDGTGTLSWTL